MKRHGVGVRCVCVWAVSWACLVLTPSAWATDTGCGSPGNCFAVHPTVGCSNVSCCRAVCGADPFCCDVEWDSFCVNGAFQLCSSCGFPGEGSCLQEQPNGSCEDAVCCKAVCMIDSFCCHVAWDELCVDEAVGLCTTCGEAGTGSCFSANGTPSCTNSECCASVCAIDPYCCDTAWDQLCQEEAFELCTPCGDPNAGSCFVVHDTPSCNVESCCVVVCISDSFCCTNNWDELCVAAAFDVCDACGDPGLQSCAVTSENPACSDAACCDAVCAIDPFCCDTAWDFICVGEAEDLCYTCGAPAAGSCFVGQSDPYCDDANCCAAVCACDSFCCESAWDSFCAGTGFVPGCGAQLLCVSNCPQDCVTSSTFAPPADGKVDGADLAVLLGDWGTCPGCCSDTVTSASFAPPPDGKVDGADLAVLLGAWGNPGCPD